MDLSERARRYVARFAPAISGAGGHNATFAAARGLAKFYHRGLADAECWALLCDYNARCDPPWTERELAHKWADAKAAHSNPPLRDNIVPFPNARAASAAGAARPASAPPGPGGGADSDAGGPGGSSPPPAPPGGGSGAEPDWQSELLWAYSRTGAAKIISHLDNVVRILQLAPEWQGKIGFDTFRSRIVVSSDAPWDDYQRPKQALGVWTDNDTTRLNAWLRRKFHRHAFNPSISDCERAVPVVARTHDFNPVRDYLDSVAWDGTARLNTWLSRYLGAADDTYARMVGPWWLISACARIYDPGCKVDTVPILEGPQGLRKSSALRVLASDEFFNDTPIDLNSKDAYTAIQGCWFVELAELDSLMRAEPSRSKAFFSSGRDRFRRAYARHESEELRQCIFVGTVNLDEYLSDPTGARRFWPIRCTRIDLDALARDRDQLWAEAAHEYHDGRLWYPASASDADVLGEAQEARTARDAWEGAVGDYLKNPSRKTVTAAELLTYALNLEMRDWSRAAQTRLGIVVTRRFRWVKRRVTDAGGDRVWVYERPEEG